MPIVKWQDLGQLAYQPAWDYQTRLHRQLVEQKMRHRPLKPGQYDQEHYFLVVEHPPVFTLGKSGSIQHLLLSEEELRLRGIEYFSINRGGDITYHGPGQIVGYPILDLECFFTDVHRYVRSLEEIILRTLADFGIEACRLPSYTGVWCPPRPTSHLPEAEEGFWQKFRKICAIGVHLSRWVTLHGFAFNVNTDLSFFQYIVPCGIAEADKTVTSLAWEVGRRIDMNAVKERLQYHFCAVFDCEIQVL
ncbi:MAG: lipoyl(octanoyl) transferase LipB [Saprospiraceae bacterium]|nr:lipoyl(octanoyl) transferase LipB [Saprospiraceae bacterium]MDW8483709.1 lipoyl(octanoyl) transferase LipB [Saprospiraceae bacterium]